MERVSRASPSRGESPRRRAPGLGGRRSHRQRLLARLLTEEAYEAVAAAGEGILGVALIVLGLPEPAGPFGPRVRPHKTTLPRLTAARTKGLVRAITLNSSGV